MAVYEVTKKGKISSRGRFSEKFHIRKRVLGIPFYNLDIIGDTPFPLLLGLFLSIITLFFPVSYLVTGVFSLYSLILLPVWYGWHLMCKREYDEEYDAKQWIESKIKCNMLKKNNIVIKYVTKGSTIEVDKFLN